MEDFNMRDYVGLDLLPYLKDKIREVDYYGILNLLDDVDQKLIRALKEFQNEDFGFMSKLEPDTRLPLSTNLGTSTAVKFFKLIFNRKEKETLAEGMVQYFENSYDSEDGRFYMTVPEVNDYPHAFWWNYEKLKEWFEYGNPEGIIVGFLNKYSQYLTKLNLDELNQKYISFILGEEFDSVDKHAMLNAVQYYELVDDSIKTQIKDRILSVLLPMLEADKDSWEDYSLEPYKVYIACDTLLDKEYPLLKENIEYIKKRVVDKNVIVPWKWDQFEVEFEEAKQEWIGHLYLDMILAIYLYEGLD